MAGSFLSALYEFLHLILHKQSSKVSVICVLFLMDETPGPEKRVIAVS